MITRIQQLLSGCVLSRLYVFWLGDTIFRFERAQDDSDGWWLWANRTPKDHKPFLELTFRTLEELEAYEYMPGQTQLTFGSLKFCTPLSRRTLSPNKNRLTIM